MIKKALLVFALLLSTLPLGAQTLTKGKVFGVGDRLYSANNSCFLSVTSTGNLTITEPTGYSWVALDLKKTAAPTVLSAPVAGESYFLTFQTTGALCIASTKSGAKWTSSKKGDKVVLEKDGRLVQYSGSSVLWSTAAPKPSFVVETLGRQGVLEFPSLTGAAASPAGAPTLTLYGATKADATAYKITDGSWSSGAFSGRLMQAANPTQAAAIPTRTGQQYLKFKFTGGTYQLLGAINGAPSYKDWFYNNTLILGYGPDKTLVFPTPGPKLSALVLNDKDCDSVNGADSYGWYMEPTVAVASNFRMLTLLDDRLRNELSLYAFENNPSRTVVGIERFKIKSYKTTEILTNLSTFYAGVDRSYIVAELASQMINFAQAKYMPDILGIKSSGHGSPMGIMNGILGEPMQIQNTLQLVKNFRGKPLDFFDFATNCNVASLNNFAPMAGLVNYVVASDLTRNSPSPSIGKRPDDGGNYSTYFASNKSVKAILSQMMDSYNASLNTPEAVKFYKSPDALKYGNTLSGWKQQLTLFDMQQFPKILTNIGGADAYSVCSEKVKAPSFASLYYLEETWSQVDFKAAIPLLFPTYTSFPADWNNFAIKQISNRRGLVWDTDKPRGMTVNRKF